MSTYVRSPFRDGLGLDLRQDPLLLDVREDVVRHELDVQLFRLVHDLGGLLQDCWKARKRIKFGGLIVMNAF